MDSGNAWCRQTLFEKIGIAEVRSCLHVIRDDRGWRIDEKDIDFIWSVGIDRSFVGRNLYG